MTYSVDVFRDAENRWRAFVSIEGQTTVRELGACGVARGNSLSLRFVRYGPEDLHIVYSPPDADPDIALNERILSLERNDHGALRMRFPSGSSLEGRSVLRAVREPLPPWRGRYTFESCADKAGEADGCWKYQIEVALEDNGWKALVSLDSPVTKERCEALAEPGRYERVDAQHLYLQFPGYAPGESPSGATYKSREDLATLSRKQGGSTVLQFHSLHAPPGLQGKEKASLVATREVRD